MSDAISPLNGAAFEAGYVTVREAGLRGMITLRGDLSDTKLKNAATAVAGVDFPGQGECNCVGERGIAWMSPDEVLVMTPHGEAEAALATISKALKGKHHLAVNVSDARAAFFLEGDKVREIIAKLAPVDMHPDAFPVGRFRRTRLAQVPAAFWLRDAKTVELICFASVAEYVFDLLSTSAMAGSEVGAL